MYKEVGETKSWKRIVIPAIILIVCFCIPVSALFIYIAVDTMTIKSMLSALIMFICIFLFSIKHLRYLYIFPLIEIDENFIVANQPLQNRRVYTLSRITKVKCYFKSVFFLHNGFPVIINFSSLDEKNRDFIIETLKGNDNSYN